jgi:hypothetical protein
MEDGRPSRTNGSAEQRHEHQQSTGNRQQPTVNSQQSTAIVHRRHRSLGIIIVKNIKMAKLSFLLSLLVVALVSINTQAFAPQQPICKFEVRASS